MQGIDISGWQSGIDLDVVPCDFVICKATQGSGFVSDDFTRQINQAYNAGKCVGVYHYIGGQGAETEMFHFVNIIKDWLGKAIPILDWESEQNSKWQNESYLKQCIQAFKEKTGIPPIVYASASCFPWDLCASENCGTWVAQYANMNPTGYQDTPWNEGAYSCVIRQYSSCGRLSGYDGNLDINKAYIDAEAWGKYANPNGDVVVNNGGSSITSSDDTLDLVAGVFAGKYGNGDVRKNTLGSRYDEVQDMVNHILSASVDTLADEVIAGKYGNGDTRKAVLSSRYDEVQAEVNSRVNSKTIDELAQEVINGAWGNNPERKQKLQAAGYDYEAIQSRVNELLG